nr:hypothetical protein [Candidatus Sigynarchaeota archaeon]
MKTSRAVAIAFVIAGTLLATAPRIESATGTDFGLLSARINDVNMSGNPPPVVTARLRSRVTVNATWYMYYEAPIQIGYV